MLGLGFKCSVAARTQWAMALVPAVVLMTTRCGRGKQAAWKNAFRSRASNAGTCFLFAALKTNLVHATIIGLECRSAYDCINGPPIVLSEKRKIAPANLPLAHDVCVQRQAAAAAKGDGTRDLGATTSKSHYTYRYQDADGVHQSNIDCTKFPIVTVDSWSNAPEKFQQRSCSVRNATVPGASCSATDARPAVENSPMCKRAMARARTF